MDDPPPASPDVVACLQRAELFDALADDLVELLAGPSSWVRLSPGATLFAQGDGGDALYVVERGRLAVEVASEGRARQVATVEAGAVVGEMQTLDGGRRTASVRAEAATTLLEVPRSALEAAMARSAALAERVAGLVHRRLRDNQLARLLPGLLGDVGPTVVEEVRRQGRWVHLAGGAPLFRRGEAGDSLYLVVSGRLVVVADGGPEPAAVLGEIGVGEPVGEMALFTGEPRSASVYALRDSELLRFDKATFEAFARRHPHVLMAMTRLLIGRLRSTIRPAGPAQPGPVIALVPAAPDVPLADVAARLGALLPEQGGALLHLDAARAEALLGHPGAAHAPPTDPVYFRLSTRLDEREARHGLALYQADPTDTPWTRRCLQRADHVVVVAWAGGDPKPGPAERLLADRPPLLALRRSLVLLHPDGRTRSRDTHRWLAHRQLHLHHHVRLDRSADLERLARFLSDRAVGLVLGGGGARGFAHIGLVRALREQGIPVDLVGGTSIGAILAAQVALEYDVPTMLDHCRATFVEPRPFRRYTFPYVSLLQHGLFDASARRTYGETDLEDLWINCLCVASNLSTARTEVIRTGPVAEAILASSALPGIVTPRIREGELLVDGGVLNNLPCDVVRPYVRTLIASDVGQGQAVRVDFDDFPSPWHLLRHRISPLDDEIRTPRIMNVLMRASLLGSLSRTQQARAEADLYLRMPVEAFGMLQMERLDEIAEAGYRHAAHVLDAWADRPDSLG